MQLSLKGDAHLLGRLALGSLLGIDVSGVEGVDVNWGTPVTGLMSGAIIALTFSSLSVPGRYAYSNLTPQMKGKVKFHPF